MATWDDVRRLALALPETSEKVSWGHAMWQVKGRGFVWERPLRKTDRAQLAELGRPAPEGPILGFRVADQGMKQAIIAEDPDVFFTVPHLDGYDAVLARLEKLDEAELAEIVEEAWLEMAPKKVADAYLAEEASG